MISCKDYVHHRKSCSLFYMECEAVEYDGYRPGYLYKRTIPFGTGYYEDILYDEKQEKLEPPADKVYQENTLMVLKRVHSGNDKTHCVRVLGFVPQGRFRGRYLVRYKRGKLTHVWPDELSALAPRRSSRMRASFLFNQ